MATTTKCMSKMNKKELYEFCKILVDENKKLQLFNNTEEAQHEELTKKYLNLQDKIIEVEYNNKKLEKEIEELSEHPPIYEKQLREHRDTIEQLKKSQICCDCQVGGECEAPGNCANGRRIEELKKQLEAYKIVLLQNDILLKSNEDMGERISELEDK